MSQPYKRLPYKMQQNTGGAPAPRPVPPKPQPPVPPKPQPPKSHGNFPQWATAVTGANPSKTNPIANVGNLNDKIQNYM